MTHFVGLVVAETEDEIAALVQPFHEYECTGVEDQYVVDIDITEEAGAEFDKDTRTMLRGPKGGLVSAYENRFYRDPNPEEAAKIGPRAGGSGVAGGVLYRSFDPEDGRGYRPMVRFVPEGFEEVVVPVSEVDAFSDWAKDYYGLQRTVDPVKRRPRGGYIHTNRDGAVIAVVKHTNPNAKWDWWVVGGRWSDMVPGHNCLVEDVPKFFTDYTPGVLIDADGWHATKERGWFGMSSPSDTPDIVKEKFAQHAGKRVWVIDFHI